MWGSRRRLSVPLAATMIHLRTSLVWLLTGWVASGPSALILHHQLAHVGGGSTCCAHDASAAMPAPGDSCCGADHPQLRCLSEQNRPGHSAALASSASQQCDPSQRERPASEDSSPSGGCSVCELLLHHHVIAAEITAFAISDTTLTLVGESDDDSPFQRRLRNWNLRGPPSC